MIYTLAAAIVLLAVTLPFVLLDRAARADARAASRYDRTYTAAQQARRPRTWQ